MAPSQPPSSDKTIRKIDIAQVSTFFQYQQKNLLLPILHVLASFLACIHSFTLFLFKLTKWPRLSRSLLAYKIG